MMGLGGNPVPMNPPPLSSPPTTRRRPHHDLHPGISQRNGATDLWHHEDWLGSTRYLTDATGNGAPTASRFDGYGLRSAFSGTDLSVLKWAGGQQYQSDLPGGLMEVGARQYDPVAGRFLSRDPIGFGGGLNLYAYCAGDPVNSSDPSGLMPPRTGFDPDFPNRDLMNGSFRDIGPPTRIRGKAYIFIGDIHGELPIPLLDPLSSFGAWLG